MGAAPSQNATKRPSGDQLGVEMKSTVKWAAKWVLWMSSPSLEKMSSSSMSSPREESIVGLSPSLGNRPGIANSCPSGDQDGDVDSLARL
jgi:hypothetical protein